MQQAFDAAQALFDKQRFAEADAAFGAIETRLLAGSHHNARTLAVARLRRAQSLAQTGESARATALLLDALPGLDASADGELRGEALLELGQAEERALDLTAASTHYRAALALAPARDPGQQIALRMRAGRTALFEDPAAVVEELRANLPLAESALAGNKQQLAQYLALYGRALLNAGQIKPARVVLDRALALSGGLTNSIDLFTLGVRGDAALAAQLGGDSARAVELTAYTGAGRSADSNLSGPYEGQPPACGGPADLQPDDLAVVQFSLGEDGVVRGATPIYASRAGLMAAEFARAVREWSWLPAKAAIIRPFFRLASRVELRCTTRAERRSTLDLLLPDVERWITAFAAELPGEHIGETPNGRVSLANLEMMLRDRTTRAGKSAPALVPILVAIAKHPATSDVAALRVWERADRIARSASAPTSVIAWIGINHAYIDAYEHDVAAEVWRARRRSQMAKVADDPLIAADPRARAAVLLVHAGMFAPTGGRSNSERMLIEVLATPVGSLGEGDPIRQAAAIRLASLQAASGQRAAAENTFRTSGLTPEQCGLLDADPVPISRPVSPNDYPSLPLKMGITGWAVTEFDVLANGRTRAPRTVIAYPAFLFGNASNRVVHNWVFRPTFRPDAVPSCGGYQTTVRYAMPWRQ